MKTASDMTNWTYLASLGVEHNSFDNGGQEPRHHTRRLLVVEHNANSAIVSSFEVSQKLQRRQSQHYSIFGPKVGDDQVRYVFDFVLLGFMRRQEIADGTVHWERLHKLYFFLLLDDLDAQSGAIRPHTAAAK